MVPLRVPNDELRIRYTQEYTSDVCHRIAAPRPAVIQLYDCRRVTDSGVAHLRGLTALQHLDLGWWNTY
jgi:hypothetical protein